MCKSNRPESCISLEISVYCLHVIYLVRMFLAETDTNINRTDQFSRNFYTLKKKKKNFCLQQ